MSKLSDAPFLFRVGSYLRPADAFHFARKDLDRRLRSPLHRHDFFELFLVEEGRARHVVNGSADIVEAGDIVFVRPDDAHCFEADGRLGCRIQNTIFRVETADHLVARYAGDLAGRFFWSDAATPVTLRLHGPQRERAVNATLPLRTSLRTLVRIEHYLMTMMTVALEALADTPGGTPEWLTRACGEARRPEVFRRGVAGFVAAAGRGSEHVCRQTRRFLGVTPTQYVNRVRIQHAAMLMGSTGLTLEEVALECGFHNMSYFHRLFRDQYGTTPGGYRRRHRRDPLRPAAALSA